MASLMTIPRELRDMILSLALHARKQPPSTIAEIEQQDGDFTTISDWSNEAVYSSNNPADYQSSALPLLLTSKQINAETLEAVGRASVQFELDVKFLKEHFLVPTWVSIPILSPKVHHLRATFQSVGTYERRIKPLSLKGRYREHDIWRTGCGGPCGYVWAFYSLLTRFLKFGPVGPTNPSTERPFTIECLELDFLDPEDTSLLPPEAVTSLEKDRAAFLHMYHANREGQPAQMLRPEWLANSLAGSIAGLLSMGYHEARYGSILYERIGRIVFKVNGDIIREFDLGQKLAELRFNDSFGTEYSWNDRVQGWGYWKQTTLEYRAKRGLKVVEPSVNWWQEAQADADRIYAGRTVGS
jgi:hypothetical protein